MANTIRQEIERYSQNWAGALRPEQVFTYLRGIGCDVDVSGGSSHVQVTLPNQKKFPIPVHADKKHLERETLRKIHRYLLEWEQAQETASAVKKMADSPAPLPNWLTAEYLEKKDLALYLADANGNSQQRTLVLIDTEYPELSVRISYRPSERQIEQYEIEGARERLNLIKHGYQTSLDDITARHPWLVLERTTQDHEAIYQLRHAESDESITTVHIPNMREEDPAQRDALLANMLGQIETIASGIERAIEAKAEQDAAVAAQRAADIAAREAKRSAAEQALQQADRANFSARYAALVKRARTIGFTVTHGEHAGKQGLVLVQRPEYLQNVQQIEAMLTALPPQSSTARKYAELEVGLLLKQDPLRWKNAFAEGQFFIPMQFEEDGVASEAELKKFADFLEVCERDISEKFLIWKEMNAISVMQQPEGTSIRVGQRGEWTVLPRGTTQQEMEYAVVSRFYTAAAENAAFEQMSEELKAQKIGIHFGKNRDGVIQIKLVAKEHAITLTRDTTSKSGIVSSAHLQECARIIEHYIKLRLDAVRDRAPEIGMQTEKDGMRFTFPDTQQQVFLPDIQLDKFNLPDVFQAVKVLEHYSQTKSSRQQVSGSVEGLESYGYRVVEAKGKLPEWKKPDGLGKGFKQCPADTPPQPTAIAKRARDMEDILKACNERLQSQTGKLEILRQHVSVKESMDGLSFTHAGRDITLRYAMPVLKKSDQTMFSPLLDDASYAELRRVTKALHPESHADRVGKRDGWRR